MRTAYFDCASGISGDMTLAALVDAGAELKAVQAGIDSLGLPTCRLVAREVKKRGFRALQISVEHAPEHKHRHLHHIVAMIDASASLAPRARELAKQVFTRLAEAEARVHGTTIEKVHFHEVGAVDSIADIVGSAIALDLLDIQRVVCSPVPTGWGFVAISHGRCSIPAPATAELLRGVPLAGLDVEGELTTPTGAAMVAVVAHEFGPLPPMRVERIGYGAGAKDFPQPNILRVIIGQSAEAPSAATQTPQTSPQVESIVLLETNLDDATGVAVGHAANRLWEAGALDVAITPIQMKKGRPGVSIGIQARPADADRLAEILFRETTTLGVRRSLVERTVLARDEATADTPWGPVAGKLVHLPDGGRRFVPEYEACRQTADQHALTLAEVMRAATSCPSPRVSIPPGP